MAHRKPHLPTKDCPVCGRPFAWRKKWARDWESVVYCSERCRRSKGAAPEAAPGGSATRGGSRTRPRSSG